MASEKTALRSVLCFAVCIVFLSPALFSQTGGNLDKVLAKMDDSAQRFRSAQANFTAKMWNSVIAQFVPPDDAGRIYLRKNGSGIEASAVYSQPPSKQIIFSGNKLQIVQNGEIKVYDAGAHRDELETFLVLGFGSSGEDMRKKFDVKDLGPENVDNVQTEKLELTPKDTSVQVHVPKILLWVDPDLGVSRQQQIYIEKEGDYRLAKYSDIKLNQNLPGNAFKLKASASAKTVSH